MRSIETILIANRGEIAVRIIRTARRLGIKTVAVFSQADRNSLHVRMADDAAQLNGSTALESYLDMKQLVAACREMNVDAVHPGYGFLSENADFARALAQVGIAFIGPSPEAIESMGNKSRAKELMAQAGVPMLPGYMGSEQSIDYLTARGCEAGFPLMVKAAAGGGGRGLRIASDAKSLRDLIVSARTEAQRAFGSGELLLERALSNARHVEVQVFGDSFGNVVHLGERDCSIQRRHQKVLEESPCPTVSAALRCEMGEVAVRAARAIDYVGAGTIEFLLDRASKFYFLEMNTRLQVEHPVTEAVTGLDLVEWQLRVARGEALPLKQNEITFSGSAIEARLYAEDPDDQFRPQIGEIVCFQPSDGQLSRTDHGLNSRDMVTPYYDAMLAKVICHGDDREMARRRLITALKNTTVFGIKTNLDFLIECLEKESYVAGDFDTAFIADLWQPKSSSDLPPSVIAMACLAFTIPARAAQPPELFGWCNSSDMRSVVRLAVRGYRTVDAQLQFHSAREISVQFEGCEHRVALIGSELPSIHNQASRIEILVDGAVRKPLCLLHQATLYMSVDGRSYAIEDVLFQPPKASDTVSDGAVLSPANGIVGSIDVVVGDRVEKGASLFTVDAMKLLQTVPAPLTGRVVKVLAEVGQQIKSKQLIIQLEMEKSDSHPSSEVETEAESRVGEERICLAKS